jgi:hypothetical protein
MAGNFGRGTMTSGFTAANLKTLGWSVRAGTKRTRPLTLTLQAGAPTPGQPLLWGLPGDQSFATSGSISDDAFGSHALN